MGESIWPQPKLNKLLLSTMTLFLVASLFALIQITGLSIFGTSSKLQLEALQEGQISHVWKSSLKISKISNFIFKRRETMKRKKQLPQSLIIGVRKCGTRALLEMLYLHPWIQKAGGEVHFFDRDENYNKGLEWYRNQMPNSYQGQITIEKSPSYFVSAEVPERIRAMNISIKLIIILRDPVIRAISDFVQLQSHAYTASFINDTSTQQSRTVYLNKSFEELAILPNGAVNIKYRPLSVSVYHTHIQRWLELFPRDQIFVVNGDQLIDDPVTQLSQIESFLNVKHYIDRKKFYFNFTKGFYCLRYEEGNRCLHETKGRKHPLVNAAVVSKLRKFYAAHNQKLYEILGQDFAWPEE